MMKPIYSYLFPALRKMTIAILISPVLSHFFLKFSCFTEVFRYYFVLQYMWLRILETWVIYNKSFKNHWKIELYLQFLYPFSLKKIKQTSNHIKNIYQKKIDLPSFDSRNSLFHFTFIVLPHVSMHIRISFSKHFFGMSPRNGPKFQSWLQHMGIW